MKSVMTSAFVSLGALLVACSGQDLAGSGEMEPDVGEVSEGIVRATATGGHDQTVMLYQKFVASNGGIGTRTCSGTYFADRVVLTAAHCLQNTFGDQVFVYFGDDFAADFAAEVIDQGSSIIVPEPGEPSHFAKADTFEQHPDWDPALFYPDLGLVFLDRALPFKPMPVARGRLGDAWIGRKVTIEGWGANVATGPTTGSGARVLRTGRSKFLGSPTAADYHPEDPNPGMLDRHIRKDVIKIGGNAPNSNGCFGDSGGPLYIDWFGTTYLAGTEYFGGLFCEEYSLYTRTSDFIHYLDDAEDRAGHERLKPELECVTQNANGSYTAFFGYDNANAVSITIPYGRDNKLALDVDGFRPTKFLPGEHDFVAAVDFTRHQTASWKVDPPHGHESEAKATKQSRRCGAADTDNVDCAKQCQSTLRSECEGGMPSFQDCMQSCHENIDFVTEFFPDCVDEDAAVTRCVAETQPGPENWGCYPGFLPFPSTACNDELDTLFACFYPY
jgi:hypothetical protein